MHRWLPVSESTEVRNDDSRPEAGRVKLSVLLGLAENRALSIADLAPLLTFAGPSPLMALAARDDLTASVATALAQHGSADVRRKVAGNPVAAVWGRCW